VRLIASMLGSRIPVVGLGSPAVVVPGRVAVTTDRGGVGVIVPPPNNAVGSGVPKKSDVRFGEGVSEGKGVGVS